VSLGMEVPIGVQGKSTWWAARGLSLQKWRSGGRPWRSWTVSAIWQAVL